MAYMSQSTKAKLAPAIKAAMKQHGIKGSLAVRNHSTLVLNIKSGSIDFMDSFNRVAGVIPRPSHMPFQPATKSLDVNPYHYQDHFDGSALKFLKTVITAMYGPDYFDHSDAQTDYFHCSHYIDVNIGNWKQAYELI